jgi:hypothetical protein
MGLNSKATGQLASAFFNDIFWFDQMACSSPHTFIWVGSVGRTREALLRFNSSLADEVERRRHQGTSSSAVHRLNYLFELACDVNLTADLTQREFTSVQIAESEDWRREICGAGFLTHVRADSLRQLGLFAGQQDQTITHFGFSREELVDVAGIVGAKGVDRLVPVGEALAFDTTWDGYDLIGDFLRRVVVRMPLTSGDHA